MTQLITQNTSLVDKKKNALHFRVTVRDREHFYKIVNWLNDNVGKGSNKWTMEGRVLKSLKRGVAISPEVYIFSEDIDKSCALYLSLL